MGKGGWIAAGLLVLVAACSTQPERTTAPPTTVPGSPSTTTGARADAALTGTVVGPDGQPLAGVPVSVVKTNTGLRVGDALVATFTFGLACIADPATCQTGQHQVDSTSTRADGTFRATLPQAYLKGYETNEDWVAQAGMPPAQGQVTGPSSSFELEVDTAVQEAPPLPLWTAPPILGPPDGRLSVTVPPTQASGRMSPTVDAVTAGGKPIWRFTGPADVRVFEDLPLRVLVTGRDDVTVRHSDGRTIYHQVVASPSVAYQGTGAPPSRGAACTLDQSAAVGCPLTDGDLVAGSSHQKGSIAAIDLGKDQGIGLLVVRGTDPADALTVEVSTDGASWHSLRMGPLGGAPGVVATPKSGASARYVRLSSTSSGEVREVSVWPGTLLSLECDADGCAEGSTSATDRGFTGLVAALLIAGVGTLVVTRLRARRSAS
jgi:hypothetical protein